MTNKDNGGPDSDRELLEMAAKAAGLHVKGWVGDRMVFFNPVTGSAEEHWSPLTDDADALLLAVSIPGLNLQWIVAEAWQAHSDQPGRMDYVRRAIVRAAAAIGSAMQ